MAREERSSYNQNEAMRKHAAAAKREGRVNYTPSAKAGPIELGVKLLGVVALVVAIAYLFYKSV